MSTRAFGRLTIDQGGHASRALVFDRNNRLVAQAVREIRASRQGRDRVEYDARALLDSVREAIAEALGLAGSPRGAMAAALATQRSNVVCWDRLTGEPLSPVISWQDRRASSWLANLRGDEAIVRRITGLPLSAHYGANKLRWCLRNIPAVRAAQRAGRLAFGPMAGFLLFNLTAEKPFVVDMSHAARTVLWDLDSGVWSETLLDWFGLPLDALPEVVPCRHPFGTLVDSGIPLRVATGDQAAALYVHGIPAEDSVFITAGTGAFVQRVTGSSRRSIDGLLTGLAFHDGRQPTFTLEGTVNGAGSALDWLAERHRGISDFTTIAEWLETVPNPPLFLNGVSGLGTPFMIEQAPIRFIGKGDAAAQAVAVIESIVFLLTVNLEAIDEGLPGTNDIHLGGGLAQFDGFCQRLADLAGRAVLRCRLTETTAQGLAFLLSDEPPPGKRHDRFEPRDHDDLIDRYRRWRSALREDLEKRGHGVNVVSSSGGPRLVAHRGYAARYPENTLPAITAALRAGVEFVEVDVQLAADGVPVLLHDVTLARTTGQRGRVIERTMAQLAHVHAGETARLGPDFADTPIPRLTDLVALLAGWPQARAFIEIKEESLGVFGIDAVVSAVMRAIAPLRDRLIPISFDVDAVERARRLGALEVGWVLHRYDEHRYAETLRPDYLFCNYRKLPADGSPLRRGSWRWVLYEVTDAATALALARRGADFIETMALEAYTSAPWSLTIDD